MRTFTILFAITFVYSGCALSSDPGGSYTHTSLSRLELPNAVQKTIQSGDYGKTITGFQKFEGIGLPYIQVNFADGSKRSYNPDGTETFRGIL